ncbi:hypothetical protein [Ochrobactrum sp. Marseille-Q0166]|uniref:hypothetical protein n=1 Tax=Ochrobactrum sp. Marseille-Q0166 TaxID=2761105 RepID=UPI0016553C09|nr:hypothetical protein [Ochrobactrum sp. Marseille-Q0166]MBC8719592.1 hypothetical protein [Ochrobactrum sp. Marseille-Q0166]
MFHQSNYIVPDRFACLLSLTDITLADMLLNCRFLQSSIDDVINSLLSDLPDTKDTTTSKLCKYVICSSIEDLKKVSRITTLLINQQAVRASINGEELLAFAQWCGTAAPFRLIRECKLPSLPRTFTLSEVSIETLGLFADHVFNLILGLLPSGIFERFQLNCSADLNPTPFPDNQEHRLAFEAHCLHGIDISLSVRGEHAAD